MATPIRDILSVNLASYIGVRMLLSFGAQIQAVALGWFVYAHTGSALSLGLIGLAQFAPAIPLMPLVGYVADHVDRRLVVAVSQVVQAAGGLGLWWVTRGADAPLWPIYGLVVLIGAARSFSNPAMQALLPGIVTAEALPRAVAMNSSAGQIATIAGPALGGLMYAAIGQSTFIMLTVFPLMAAGLLLTVKASRTAQAASVGGAWERALAGLVYVFQNRLVLGSISLDLFAVLLGGVTSLLPIFAKDILHVGPQGLGLLQSGPAIGALVTGLVLSSLPLKRRAGAIMLWAVAGYGVATAIFGLSTSFWLSMACLIALGAFDMVSVVVRQTLVQIATPDQMRGRVGAVNSVFVGASNQLGGFESGVVAALVGAPLSAVIGGAATLGVVAAIARFFPEVRRADSLHGDGP